MGKQRRQTAFVRRKQPKRAAFVQTTRGTARRAALPLRPSRDGTSRFVLPPPEISARDAGLRYFSDEIPGITRVRRGKNFAYRNPGGERVRDHETLAWIRALAIPPAWTDVWIAPDRDSHLLATGRDAKGRKQYRYNPGFARGRDRAKFDHLVAFVESLPKLRRQVAADMALSGLPRRKVIATIVFLLERTGTRIGNESYARQNGSFGLATLRNHHVKARGGELRFLFRGKSGKEWNIHIQNRRVAKIIRACQELPGQHLFEYRDAEGQVRSVGSSDVNDYLREVTGREITAKDFRTWRGTLEAALGFHMLVENATLPSKTAVRGVLEHTAEALGNTVTVCRKCYVHPLVIDSYLSGAFKLGTRIGSEQHRRFALRPEESAVLKFLKAEVRRRKTSFRDIRETRRRHQGSRTESQ